jgi:signal transduction histidine kinase/CheY-like chemotaxis protein
MNSSRRLAILFVTTGFVLLGSFVALFLIGVVSVREYQALQLHQEISRQLTASLSRLRDAESAERGYIITGDARELKAYDESILDVHSQLNDLAKRRPNELDAAQVKTLGQLVEGEVAELRQEVELRRGSGFDEAMARFRTGADARQRRAVEGQIDAMLAGQKAVLGAAQVSAARSLRARTQLFLALFVLNLAVLVWSYRRLKREARARQTALNDARAARDELEKAGRAKDQFLASLSHELRTPLTPVLAMLSAWQVDGQVPASLRADVQLMRRNVELEARLIDDLLDLTRIARGKLHLNCEVADVHELVGAALKVCGSETLGKGIRVVTDLAAVRHHASVDPARLQQVLWNVLKNATKFTPEKGSIHVSTRNTGNGNIEICVRDSGIGMSATTLARVFEPFEQGEGEVLRRFGGLGLGMAISKTLVESQDGTIRAESEGAGKGSAFTVSLAAVDAPVIAAASAPVAAAGARRGLRILVVEDHADTADVLKRVLRSRGHEVCVCDSIAAARSAVEAGGLDLLLSDLGLPDGTGLDLIRQVRRRHKFPAIALTGYGMDDDVARCKDAGFDGHLTKPVSFEKLDALIGQFTSN